MWAFRRVNLAKFFIELASGPLSYIFDSLRRVIDREGDGRAERRNNKIKLVAKVSQITVKRVGWLLLVLVYLFTIDHDRYWQSCETGGGEEEQCPAPHPAWWCGPASTHQPPQLGH